MEVATFSVTSQSNQVGSSVWTWLYIRVSVQFNSNENGAKWLLKRWHSFWGRLWCWVAGSSGNINSVWVGWSGNFCASPDTHTHTQLAYCNTLWPERLVFVWWCKENLPATVYVLVFKVAERIWHGPFNQPANYCVCDILQRNSPSIFSISICVHAQWRKLRTQIWCHPPSPDGLSRIVCASLSSVEPKRKLTRYLSISKLTARA